MSQRLRAARARARIARMRCPVCGAVVTDYANPWPIQLPCFLLPCRHQVMRVPDGWARPDYPIDAQRPPEVSP